MKGIMKSKWVILMAWMIGTIALFFTAPDMAELVREKGQLEVADEYSSKEAQQYLQQLNEQEGLGNTTSIALVFHNEKGLTDGDRKEAEKAVSILREKKEELGITKILTHFDQKELEDQLLAKDGKTILVSLTVDWEGRSAKQLSKDLYSALDDLSVEHYYTGSSLIDEDVVLTSEAGLKKTESITVVFILIVLIAVFRSLITPFIPLITVGISYLVSQSIVAFLVDTVNFPLSNFTQIFLVAVLFGIGTDYSILLLSRYKEELIRQETLTEAIVETYKYAGKTVFYSGLAVLIGFSAIGFSQFTLYQSAAAVAVGIAVLLVALFTLVPFFMSVMGKKLFWPAKGSLEHKPSRLWNTAGRFSFARPFFALTIVAIITVPFIVTYDGDLSYNSLDEIGDGYRSVKGFEIIADSFGPGESMPTGIVIKNDEAMDQTEYMYIMENVSRELEKIDGVETVRSLTRPTGMLLEDFLVANQTEQLRDGIREGNDGLVQIRDGLREAREQLTASKPQWEEATGGIEQLVTGTEALKSGITELQNGLIQIEEGVRSGSIGAGDLKSGLEELKENARRLLEGYKQLADGYNQLEQQINEGLLGNGDLLASFSPENLSALDEAVRYLDFYISHQSPVDPVAKQSVDGLKTFLQGLKEQAGNLSTALENVNGGMEKLKEANEAFAGLNGGQEAVIAALEDVVTGVGELQSGLADAANGQHQIISQLPEVSDGLNEIRNGQEQLLQGFGGIGDELGQLTEGLDASVDGLTQVHDGLHQATDFLTELSSNDGETGIFIPQDVLENEQFKEVLDMYLSKDRKIAVIDVVFNENPYATETINRVDDLKEAVARAVQGTKLENAKVAIGGVTSTYHDLSTMSNRDFFQTVVFMLIGIGLILIVLFRSFIMPIYLMASLLMTYFTTMGITEFLFVNLLGFEGITWAVPFFSFVILIALGVDYSIFLMGRFNEYRGEPVYKGMISAMSNMGTVIISAVIILGGTFAAMLPSGVLSLLQIATVVIFGLVLYSLVILPLFVPVMVKTFGKANWWPFIQEETR